MIEPLDRTLFELVSDSNGKILDLDPELSDLLPSPSGSHLNDIFQNYEFTNIQNVALKSKFSYSIPAQLIFRGKIENDSIFRKY